MRANPISGYLHYVASVTKTCAPRCDTGHPVSQGTLKEVMCRGALSVTGHRRVPPEPLYSRILLRTNYLGQQGKGKGANGDGNRARRGALRSSRRGDGQGLQVVSRERLD